MASIRFSRKEFEKSIKINEEIEEKIRLFGTPLEGVTKDEIEIEIFPNRPDLLSLQGYLRSFKAFLGKEKGIPKYNVNKPEKDFKVIVDDSVKEIRPYTVCTIVKGVTFNDEKIKEIVDMQEKLHATVGRNRKRLAIGIYPMEKISLPIKYTALNPENIKFQPLESERIMSAKEILQNHPTGKEYASLLEKYNKYPVFIDAKNKILSMPPIINSSETGKVINSTKNVFIECSGYDLQALKKTLNIIACTLADLGGKIYQMEVVYGKDKIITPSLEPEKMKLSLERTNKLLGLNLNEKDLQKNLEKMRYSYSSGFVTIPAWRIDVMHEVDIIEDVAIAYGYEKITPELPEFASISNESKESKIKSILSDILSGLGLLEVSSYHLIKSEEAKNADLTNIIEVENSKTDYKILRPNLLVPTLRILSENKDNEYPQKIFEIGKVFRKNGKEIKEENELIIALTPGNFTDIKKILNSLLQQIGIECSLEHSNPHLLIEGRSADIKINNEKVGYIGEMHPESLKTFNIKMPISLAVISLDVLSKFIK